MQNVILNGLFIASILHKQISSKCKICTILKSLQPQVSLLSFEELPNAKTKLMAKLIEYKLVLSGVGDCRQLKLN